MFSLESPYRKKSLKGPEMKIVGFGNSVNPDEVAHYEPPHLDVHCLPFIG